MNAVITSLIWAIASLGAVAMLCGAALKGWRLWVELRRHEIAAERSMAGDHQPAARIEMADMKERLRRLEAIARGVDL